MPTLLQCFCQLRSHSSRVGGFREGAFLVLPEDFVFMPGWLRSSSFPAIQAAVSAAIFPGVWSNVKALVLTGQFFLTVGDGFLPLAGTRRRPHCQGRQHAVPPSGEYARPAKETTTRSRASGVITPYKFLSIK